MSNYFHKKSRKNTSKSGFMVISFVIAVSLAMLGMLTSLAALASEQVGLRNQIDGRQRTDEIALDCIYMSARVLAVHGSVDKLNSKRIPVMDGFCTIMGLEETPIYDEDGQKVIGTRVIFAARSDFLADFHSNIRAEIRIIDGRVNLIRI